MTETTRKHKSSWKPQNMGLPFGGMMMNRVKANLPEMVFRMFRPFQGPNFERLFKQVLKDPVGLRILDEGRSLLPVLSDLDRLRALPDGTLGREYQRFVEKENLDIVAFAEASLKSMSVEDYSDKRAFILAERMRDMHDLLHVISGYGTDFIGEMASLEFQVSDPEFKNPMIAMVVKSARSMFEKRGMHDAVRIIDEAPKRGQNAAFFPAVEWETLLELPVDEVRKHLNVSPPPTY